MLTEVKNMGSNDLAIRFTENTYATKSEVSKELKISVIDGVWDKILSYRSPFYNYLTIKGVDKNQLRVCLCPTISNKACNAAKKLERLLGEYQKLDHVSKDADHFEQTQLIKALQNVALKNNLLSDEEKIRQVIHGMGNRDLTNYLAALNYIKKHYSSNVDIDFLAELYSAVTGNNELTYFYRDFDGDDVNASVISRVYSSAPHMLIEQMMNGLFNLIEHSSLDPLIIALISYYYVCFVKPFKNFNEEIAILIAKSVLAHSSVGEFAIYLPLESLLNEPAVEMSKCFHEVQVTSDVTYFLTYVLDAVSHYFDKMLDSIAEYTAAIMKKDFYRLDEEVKEEKVETISLFDEQPAEEVKPVQEAPKPVEVKKEVVKVQTIENRPQGLAVSYIPEELDEKSALRLERHLLELDLRLKKGQAYFYARHCTLGMYYTIEQYRKAVKCVYETARTSMDKLVEYGYYKKEAFGKKFVYTPVDRKGE